ncbi:MAG: iron dicitrate transport regulator FecR [Bacteroidetes bacterium]|jgi:transmembrane sensor|nr:iron dicitrate transport regulator FecR [Bacteroidota bacterium]
MDKKSLPPDLRDLADDEAKKEDYRTLWSLLHHPASEEGSSSFDVDDAWNELSDTLDLDATSPHGDRSPRPSKARSARASTGIRRGVWASAVTSVLAVVVVAALFIWWSRPVTVSTKAGVQEQVTLPDGSVVALNGASTLTYDRGFDRLPFLDADTRSVELRGEAYFEVEHGTAPFRVESENAVVQVLGTAFTVRALRSGDTPSTDVVLETGRVRLHLRPGQKTTDSAASDSPDPARSVVLDTPGMRSRVVGTSSPESPREIDLKYMAAWRTGGFAAQNESLNRILGDLERQFGTNLRLSDDVDRSGTLTLHYARSVALEDVLRDICVIQGLSYRKTQEGYLLEPS